MKTFLVISQIIYLLCVIPWLFIWGISFMGFDSGISALAIGIVTVIGLYPLAVIICSIVAWVIHMRRRRTAIIVNLIPMLWVLGLVIPVIILNLT